MSALDGLVLSTGTSLADVSGVVSSVTANWSPGTVAELVVVVADHGGTLQGHEMFELGSVITWGGAPWQVGSVDRTYTGWGVLVAVAARSQLAKTLRLTSGTSATRGVSPAQWIERKVKAAGGKAICQTGAKRRTIVQKRGQSVLDVITALASDTGVEWVEADGLVVVGTPWWAYQGGPGLPTWAVTWRGDDTTDAMSLTSKVSEDDKTQGASASVTLPRSRAEGIRPWHRLSIAGAGAPLDGIWLVGDVSLTVGTSAPVTLNLTRPLASAPKKGSAKASSTKATPAKSPTSTPSGGTHRPYASTSGITSTNGGTAHDYAMSRGTTLYAVRDGYVISCRDGVPNHARGGPADRWPAAANYVLLGVTYAGKPARVLYWHMSPGLRVSKGQKVSAGQVLGESGNTGHSTGDHLHIQAAWGHQDSTFGGPIIYPPSKVWS